jgi:hypothetical protein
MASANVWNRLDKNTQRQIIETIIKAFEDLFRAYYRDWKNQR